jgi:hypothetical protein
MIATATLEQSARRLVKRVVDRTDTTSRRGRTGRLALDGAVVVWLLPHLVQLVDDLHDRPIEALEPVIRRMLMEQAFVDDNGDAVMTEDERAQINEQVHWLVRILEHARRHARPTGEWSAVPVTPQMCG